MCKSLLRELTTDLNFIIVTAFGPASSKFHHWRETVAACEVCNESLQNLKATTTGPASLPGGGGADHPHLGKEQEPEQRDLTVFVQQEDSHDHNVKSK